MANRNEPAAGERQAGGQKKLGLDNLVPAPRSHRDRKRLGRGPGSGTGKTSGKGHKGIKARAGHHGPGGGKPQFEGGQMPLTRRVPKWKGFTNPNREEWAVVNLDSLAAFEAGSTVTVEDLRGRGMVPKRLPVKVLGRGDIDRALTVRAHAFSKAARQKIEGAGGTVELLVEPKKKAKPTPKQQAAAPEPEEAPKPEAAGEPEPAEAEPPEEE